MRQKQLEMLLQRIPSHPTPRADLEQYATPAPIAADLLYRAHATGDVAGKRVLDLGCGTGVFATGALILGAESAVGIDVDIPALAIGRAAAQALGVAPEFVESDVKGWNARADVVLMNPPFGSQQRGADRPFLEAALRCAPVVYSMHLAETEPFVREFVSKLGGEVSASWTYAFPLRWQFAFQEKPVAHVDVAAMRLTRQE